MATYEEAVELLKNPATWQKGARALAKLGDPRAILPLLTAYELPIEGGDKLSLADALRALTGESALGTLAKARSADERRAAARIRRLFAQEAHIDPLEHALSDESPLVRAEARLALASQPQTPRWERAMGKMLAAPETESRQMAIAALAKRRTPSARAILRDHAQTEQDPHLRALVDRKLDDR